MKKLLLLLTALACSLQLWAQTTNENYYIEVQMTPDHHDWVYKVGEKVTFNVAVIKDSYPQQNLEVKYSWGQETYKPDHYSTLNTGSGYKSIKLDGLDQAGFKTLTATVEIDGKEYTNFINVAFEPEKIKTVVNMPDDFSEFWNSAISENSKVPLETIMTLVPEECTHSTNVYHIRFQNTSGTYIYGVLSTPKQEGVYPAVLIVPGAGVRAYYGSETYTSKGVISLSIGIHGIPIDLSDEVYTNLRAGALLNYNKFNYDDRDKHYFKRVFLGSIKAVDFLCSLPNVDSSKIGVIGNSQGGLISMVVGSMEKRVKCLVVNYPGTCNMSGVPRGLIGDWVKRYFDTDETNLETKIAVSEYYDGVNFARLIDKPVYFGLGFNDAVCPPTSTYSTFNEISSEKKLLVANVCGHWLFPEQRVLQVEWLVEQLNK